MVPLSYVSLPQGQKGQSGFIPSISVQAWELWVWGCLPAPSSAWVRVPSHPSGQLFNYCVLVSPLPPPSAHMGTCYTRSWLNQLSQALPQWAWLYFQQEDTCYSGPQLASHLPCPIAQS